MTKKRLPSNDDPIISNNVSNTPISDKFSTPLVPYIKPLDKGNQNKNALMIPIPNNESYPYITQNIFIPLIKYKQTASLELTKNLI